MRDLGLSMVENFPGGDAFDINRRTGLVKRWHTPFLPHLRLSTSSFPRDTLRLDS